MSLFNFVDEYIEKGRTLWGIDPQWEIRANIVDGPAIADEGGSITNIGISMVHYPSKRATIEISRDYMGDPFELWQDILHELGHIVTCPLWRTITDYLDNIPETKEGTLTRNIIEENFNSTENILIDHLVFQVLLKQGAKDR